MIWKEFIHCFEREVFYKKDFSSVKNLHICVIIIELGQRHVKYFRWIFFIFYKRVSLLSCTHSLKCGSFLYRWRKNCNIIYTCGQLSFIFIPLTKLFWWVACKTSKTWCIRENDCKYVHRVYSCFCLKRHTWLLAAFFSSCA